jgi:FixJ family two-component response regulator
MHEDGLPLSGSFNELWRQPWLTTLFEHLPLSIGVYDEAGTLLFGNRQFLDPTDSVGLADVRPECASRISPQGRPIEDGIFPCIVFQSGSEPDHLADRASSGGPEPSALSVPIYLIHPEDCEESPIATALAQAGLRVNPFASPAEFLKVAEIVQTGCVLIDLRKAGYDREQVLQVLEKRPPELQIILIGSESTPASEVILALKAGAADFLLEPFHDRDLTLALHKACRHCHGNRVRDGDGDALNQRLLALSAREREVLLGLIAGGTNKTIARSLNLSPRTIEVHRSHLMQRLNVRNLTALLHLARDAGLKAVWSTPAHC